MSSKTEASASTPFNLEAEQSLLGAILLDREAFDRVAEVLKPEHFYNPDHREVYKLCAEMIGAGKTANRTTIVGLLPPKVRGKEAVDFLNGLIFEAATFVTAPEYAKIIRDLAIWRQVKELGNEIVERASRRDADLEPDRELQEIERKLADLKAGRSHKQSALQSSRASGVEMRALQWLWPNRFAIGKLGLVVGLPDEGKGQLFCNMAATVTRGAKWPCGEGTAPQGNVVLLTAEDDISDTVVPRLSAASADLDRVEIVNMVRDGKRNRMFSLATDLDLLRQKIKDVGNVKLVQIDPLTAYLGNVKMDSFRTTDVRAVLSPVVDLAAELKVAIVGIMHFNKNVSIDNALLRISDSLAYGATARHVYAVIDDADSKRKLVVRGKNNLSAHADRGLAYRFGARMVGTDPETRQENWAPCIEWEPHHVDITASQAMAATKDKAPSARDQAKEFLLSVLAGGPMLKTEIEEAADANGISERTLFNAKADLGVVAKRDGPDGKWRWHPPKAAS
jgi:putative DNA primase/helicase